METDFDVDVIEIIKTNYTSYDIVAKVYLKNKKNFTAIMLQNTHDKILKIINSKTNKIWLF